MDRWIEELPDDDREAVITAVRNPEWKHVDLLAALVEEGAPKIAPTTFANWRWKRGLAR